MSLLVGTNALLVAAFGGIGAASRLAVDGVVRDAQVSRDAHARRGEAHWAAFPWGTLAVNVIGSFLIGLGSVLLASSHTVWLAIGTGFLGGFTTFSTAMVDVVTSWFNGHRRRGLAGAVIVLVACVAAAALGVTIATEFSTGHI